MTISPQSTERGSKTRRIVQELRERLSDRAGAVETPLTERGVAREFEVSRMTARQALRHLVESGHLQVDPSRGYWPAAPTKGAVAAPRIAFVKVGGSQQPDWPAQLGDMWGAIQDVIVQAGGTVTAVGELDPSAPGLSARLADMGIDGVILDCAPDATSGVVNKLGVPCVVVNTPTEPVNADVLVQDNATGGYLAGRHLLDLGHERICWLGWPTESAHGRERFGGFLAALTERGLSFDPQRAAFVDEEDAEGVDQAIDRLLAHEPTAVVALWAALAARTADRIHHAGLSIPEQVSLVTWGAVEGFPWRWQTYCARPQPLPDAVHWRMKDMVDAALSRLAERIRNPLGPAVKLFLPVHMECRGTCRAIR